MIAVSTNTTLTKAAQALGTFLPRLVGAIVLLVLGIIVARLIARLVCRGLSAAGIDELGERWGVNPVLQRAGLPPTLSRLARSATRLALTLVVIFAALSLLGLQFLSQSLNEAVLFVPNLLVACALLLAGVVVAALVRERAERLAVQLDFPLPLGQLAQVLIIALFAITAAAQVAVSTTVLLLLVAILVTAAAAMVALAFGLGGRDMARALSAGRYVRGAYAVGDTIALAGVRGEIVAIEPVAIVLRTAEGRVRVPNHMLVEAIVTLADAPG